MTVFWFPSFHCCRPHFSHSSNVAFLAVVINPFNHQLLSLWCHFWQCPWDLGSASAERAGQRRRVGASNSVAASGFGCTKALVGTGWAIFLLLYMNRLRKQSSGLLGPPFLIMRFFLVCTCGHWPKAVAIENSLMSGCVWVANLQRMAARAVGWSCSSNPKGTGDIVYACLRDQ